MGIGLIIACADTAGERVLELLRQAGEAGARAVGRIVAGDPAVRYVS